MSNQEDKPTYPHKQPCECRSCTAFSEGFDAGKAQGRSEAFDEAIDAVMNKAKLDSQSWLLARAAIKSLQDKESEAP